MISVWHLLSSYFPKKVMVNARALQKGLLTNMKSDEMKDVYTVMDMRLNGMKLGSERGP